MQLEYRDFKSEASQITSQSSAVKQSLKEAISVFSAVTKATSDCCKLPLKTTEADQEEKDWEPVNVAAAKDISA